MRTTTLNTIVANTPLITPRPRTSVVRPSLAASRWTFVLAIALALDAVVGGIDSVQNLEVAGVNAPNLVHAFAGICLLPLVFLSVTRFKVNAVSLFIVTAYIVSLGINLGDSSRLFTASVFGLLITLTLVTPEASAQILETVAPVVAAAGPVVLTLLFAANGILPDLTVRVRDPYRNENLLANLIVCLISCSVYTLLIPGAWERGRKIFRQKRILWLLVALLSSLLLRTQTRAALIAFGIGGVVLLLDLRAAANNVWRRFAGASAIVLALSVLVVTYGLPDWSDARLVSTASAERSAEQRATLRTLAANELAASPTTLLLGRGPGNVSLYVEGYDVAVDPWAGPHNSYLGLALQSGVVFLGLLGLLVILYGCTPSKLRARRVEWACLLLPAVAAFAEDVLLMQWNYYDTFLVFLFLGSIVATARTSAPFVRLRPDLAPAARNRALA